MTNAIKPTDRAEYEKLFKDFVEATTRAGAILQKYGMDSDEFLKADQASSVIWKRLREIQGMAGKHWMS